MNTARFTFVLAFVAGALTMTGCRSVPVEIMSMTAPDSLQTNQNGSFSVVTNEKAKQPVSVSWNFGDQESADGASTSHSFDSEGTYTVTATATNRKGKSTDLESTTVVVMDPPVPAGIVSLRADPPNPDTETAVRFSATVNGDAPLTYAWDFGDGSTAASANPSHTFSNAGTYSVSLNVTNRAGTDSRSMSVTVVPFEAEICREVTELSPAFFATNSSVLDAEARSALSDNLQILGQCPNMNVRVEGIAAPGERLAQELSTDRARAVEQFYM